MPHLKDWIGAARPKTLAAAVAPVMVGTVLAWKISGSFSPWLLACTLASCMALQIATNLFNDALDHLRGADTSERLGPRRITAAGAASADSTLRAGSIVLALATAAALPLLGARGWPILAIGIPSLYFCYGYTGGPAPLAYRGLGELFVILFFGLVAVLGTVFVQTGGWHRDAIIAGFQIGCLSTVLIAVNNLRDIAEDRSTGKRTLAVRFGARFARWEILMLIAGAYLLGLYWWAQGDHRALAYPLALLPVGTWLAFSIFKTPPGRVYNRFLAVSGLHLLLFAILLCLGLATHA